MRPAAQTVYVAVYSLQWHATAAPNPRQQVCRHFILMSRQQWIIEGRLVAALLCRSSYHMQPTYISNGRPSVRPSVAKPHILCTQNSSQIFPYSLTYILYMYIYIFFFSLWREGFCFVKSRQVCFRGMRDPNTPTRNGYFSVAPFWNMYYKIVGLQYLVLFNLQSPLCEASDIVSYIDAPPIPATNVI